MFNCIVLFRDCMALIFISLNSFCESPVSEFIIIIQIQLSNWACSSALQSTQYRIAYKFDPIVHLSVVPVLEGVLVLSFISQQ